MADLIQPRILKGFRDFLPAAEIERNDLTEKITAVYRSFGFVPIDTPVLEYTEILLRKSNGETEKQVFRFEDNGGRDVAMRFDLTVPFARFVAEHKSELYFPFKRYHIAKVWRGEKPQAGRYREFMQCDVDTVGSDSAAADFEILNVMRAALVAVGAGDITIHVNSRATFNRFLAKLGVSEKSEDILRSVDKLAKIGRDKVLAELVNVLGGAASGDSAANAGDSADAGNSAGGNTSAGAEKIAAEILSYIEVPEGASFEETLSHIEKMAGGLAADTERMREIRAMMKAAGIADTYVLDPAITRGLDYYTGIVYETFLNKLPQLGSVCSGGRYDNLAGLYMKEKVPGVGVSIGLDRLLAGLHELGIETKKASYLDAEIFCMKKEDTVLYQRVASQLRERGIAVEVFPDAKKINQQYAVTDAKGIVWGIFVSGTTSEQNATSGSTSLSEQNPPDENVTPNESGFSITLKNLKTREQFENISMDDVVATISSC